MTTRYSRSFRRQPTHVPGMLTRREVVDYYGERSGWRVDNFDFYEVFGLFRLMVIIQQIYRRFVLGQTSNPQFAGFGDAARYMGQRCRRLIARAGCEHGQRLLIRHGQASFGGRGLRQVSAHRRAQSRQLGEWLARPEQRRRR